MPQEKSGANLDGLDLFGNPLRHRSRERGRPAFEVTPEDVNKVRLLLALGWQNERIANALVNPGTGKPISLATLKRYFRADLAERDKQRDRLDARRFMIAMEQADTGNIGALKELARMIERNDLMRVRVPSEDKPKAKAEPIGKKEQALRDAKTAGQDTGWGDDLVFPGLTN